RLRAQDANGRAMLVRELASERDVGAFLRGVLRFDEHERREVLELAAADRVGAKARVVRDANQIMIDIVRALLRAARQRDQQYEVAQHPEAIAPLHASDDRL